MLKLKIYATKNCNYVYANDTVLRGIRLTLLIEESNFSAYNNIKQNGTRLENKTPREIMNIDRKTELKRLL